jgi:hypothetical protein
VLRSHPTLADEPDDKIDPIRAACRVEIEFPEVIPSATDIVELSLTTFEPEIGPPIKVRADKDTSPVTVACLLTDRLASTN